MEVQILECNKIEESKTGKELRTFSREFAVKLAEAIKTEGLRTPITVRPNPEKPGYYIRVAGKHRHVAVQKILKEQFIAADVLQDFDPKDHEMALISENLWRNPLTKAQMTLSIKRWYEYYANKHSVEKSAPKAAPAAAPEERGKSKENAGEASDTESPKDEPRSTEAFTEAVSASTGVAKRTAQRLVRIAKMFADDELETFQQCCVAQHDQERISRIKDAALRSQIISLIASGMSVEDSFKEVIPADEIPKANHSERESDTKAKAAARVEKAPAMTDDEWYETYCGEKAALIASDHEKFKADALLYREISEARAVFRAKAKKALERHKLASGKNGPLYSLVRRLVYLSGPKDWFICGACNATDAKSGCSECYEAGYKLKTEDY